MTHFDKLRQQWAIIRMIADEIYERQVAEFRLADARVRLAEASPPTARQIFGGDQVFGFSSGEIA
jgi:hypothetical protein